MVQKFSQGSDDQISPKFIIFKTYYVKDMKKSRLFEVVILERKVCVNVLRL